MNRDHPTADSNTAEREGGFVSDRGKRAGALSGWMQKSAVIGRLDGGGVYWKSTCREVAR